MKADAKGRGGLAGSEVAWILSGLRPRFLEGLEPAEGQGDSGGRDQEAISCELCDAEGGRSCDASLPDAGRKRASLHRVFAKERRL